MAEFDIEGDASFAVYYGTQLNEPLSSRIAALTQLRFTEGCKLRIMPNGGLAMSLNGMLPPRLAGSDLGFGAYCLPLGPSAPDQNALQAAIARIPAPSLLWDKPLADFDFCRLRSVSYLSGYDAIICSLGVLGYADPARAASGMADIARAASGMADPYESPSVHLAQGEDACFYLVVCNGSFLLGAQVMDFYHKLALANRAQAEFEESPEELSCLSMGLYLDFLNDEQVCRDFAALGRELIAQEICRAAGLSPAGPGFHTPYNSIEPDSGMLRAGCAPAQLGRKGLIPLSSPIISSSISSSSSADSLLAAASSANTKTQDFVLYQGLGSRDWNESLPCSLSVDGECSAAAQVSGVIMSELAQTAQFTQVLKGIFSQGLA